ncbi:putative membrane protein [Paenibacillus castaneae]|nr:putative membrane protein [Paenibacillus castaneae]
MNSWFGLILYIIIFSYLLTVFLSLSNDETKSIELGIISKRVFYSIAITLLITFIILILFYKNQRIADERTISIVAILLSLYQLIFTIKDIFKRKMIVTILLWCLALYTYAFLLAEFFTENDNLVGWKLRYENLMFKLSYIIVASLTLYYFCKSIITTKVQRKENTSEKNSSDIDYYI